MVSIILVVLFISQLLSFFFIILLNSKLAGFKELEARQEQVISEMDDAIGVYLMEMKEENDRLIKEITAVKQMPSREQGDFEEIGPPPRSAPGREEDLGETQATAESRKPYVPIAFATNAYSRQKQDSSDKRPVQKAPGQMEPMPEQTEPSRLTTFEQEVVKMHQDGKTIEEIAKKTQKGKTEIELLIKFHA